MKKLSVTLILFFGLSQSYGQSITYEDFKSLIPYLRTEDWKTAFKESSKLLQTADKDTSDFKAIVLYINIYSAAGMVSAGQMTYKELEKNVVKFQGQKIVMSAHPVAHDNGGALNATYLTVNDTTNEAFTTATNSKETNILCFEKFYIKDKIIPEDFQTSAVRCGGTLEKIELNPNKSMVWILRLTVKDAFARKAN